MKIALGDKPRILITRADRIGDLILSTAVFPEIRKKFPKAWIACIAFLEHREILEGNPYLNEVILYDKTGSEKGFFGNRKFVQNLAAKKFDVVVHLHATNRMHWIAWFAGIPIRIGWQRRAAWTLTRSYPDVKKQGLKHEAEYNFDLLESMGISCPVKPELYFPVSERVQRSLEMFLRHTGIPQDKPWIILGPGASCPSKTWPAERFGYFANAWNVRQQTAGGSSPLNRRMNPSEAVMADAVFIGIGSAQDRERMARIRQVIRAPFYDWSGKLSLGMLGALLKRSALMVSNDSGPAHAAAALGTPVISIFGRNQPGLSPKRWRPLGDKSVYVWKNVGCDPCLAHACQIHFLCLDVIAVEDVVKEAEKFKMEAALTS